MKRLAVLVFIALCLSGIAYADNAHAGVASYEFYVDP